MEFSFFVAWLSLKELEKWGKEQDWPDELVKDHQLNQFSWCLVAIY